MTIRIGRAVVVLAAAMSVSHCAMFAPDVAGRVHKLPETAVSARLLPAGGRQLIIIGQQPDSPEHEPNGLGPPGGVMLYTAFGAGPEAKLTRDLQPNADSIAGRNPESALQIGLNLVDRLDEINSGGLDDNIERLIGALMQTRRPVYLRFGYEFDGEWNHYYAPAYRQAWLRFRAKLVASGATNIAMVWHAAAFCGGTFGGAQIEQWYPGDDAVDWIGMSWFVPSPCDYSRVRAMVDFARRRHKPLMIAESAPRGYDLGRERFSWNGRKFDSRGAGSIWREWYAPYFDFIHQNADVVRAVAYISDNWDSLKRWGPPYTEGYYGNSQLDANSGIASRWKSEMRDDNWLRGGPDLPRQLSMPPP